MRKEQDIQRDILDYLKTLGAYSVKTMVTTSNGVPDILCCLNGMFLGIEVKKDDGVVSKIQEYHIAKIKEAGGKAFVARSVDDVKKEIGLWLAGWKVYLKESQLEKRR